ncbi:dihydrorhizobitoxine desaturase [Streptomyces populi]|uniref:Dihydrorhizobitoxine desaturase n=1 Tax=Streptomyces populi TaxID=2058924 RepID=A0A2I0SHB5_9ACTN|nr:fatty acid desaturase family protein [Streptomyces populi]PKT69327.1 dihydrorhizobitoxine desaturase [Streptomyces populi]
MSTQWAVHKGRYKPYRFDKEIQEHIRELNRLDNWHGIMAFASDAFWITAAIWLSLGVSYWFYPVTLIVVGSRMRALATLLHESAHGTLARNRVLNLVLGTALSAYPIFQTHYAYKKTHVATHHPKLGRPDVDPDLVFFIEQGVYEEGLSERQRWMKLVVLPALGARTLAVVKYLLMNRLGGAKDTDEAEVRPDHRVKARRDRIAFVVFWAAALGLLGLNGLLGAFALFWIVPFLTTFQIISWYIELAEHTPLVRDHDVNLYMTRNRKSRGLERFLTAMHRENFHLDHHLDVRTPYWNMRKVHELRLRDAEYASWDARAGGLFTKGPQGQDSAIRQVVRGLGERGHRPVTGSAAPAPALEPVV